MLDNYHRRLLELLRQLPTCVQVHKVVEAQFLALQLRCAGNAQPRAVRIKRRPLVRVFPVTQRLRQPKIDAKRSRQGRRIRSGNSIRRWSLANRIQRIRNRRIVRRGRRKSLPRQPPASLPAQTAARSPQLLSQRRVIAHPRHNRHVFKILGRGTNHRRSANVDVLNQVAERHSRLRRRLFKRIEIHHHHVDRLNSMRGHRGLVLLVSADVKQSSVYARMQRLHAPVQHLRKTRQIADVPYRQSRFAQRPRRSARRHQLHPKASQRLGKLHQPRLIRNAQQRPPYPLFCTHNFSP